MMWDTPPPLFISYRIIDIITMIIRVLTIISEHYVIVPSRCLFLLLLLLLSP